MIEITTIIKTITNIDIIFTFDNLSIISILTTILHSILFKSIKRFFYHRFNKNINFYLFIHPRIKRSVNCLLVQPEISV